MMPIQRFIIEAKLLCVTATEYEWFRPPSGGALTARVALRSDSVIILVCFFKRFCAGIYLSSRKKEKKNPYFPGLDNMINP